MPCHKILNYHLLLSVFIVKLYFNFLLAFPRRFLKSKCFPQYENLGVTLENFFYTFRKSNVVVLADMRRTPYIFIFPTNFSTFNCFLAVHFIRSQRTVADVTTISPIGKICSLAQYIMTVVKISL